MCSVAVVPRFDRTRHLGEEEAHPSVRTQLLRDPKGKRKAGRISPELIPTDILRSFKIKDGLHVLGHRRFNTMGLEVLTIPSAHHLVAETDPPEQRLRQFELTTIRPEAVQKAYCKIVRKKLNIYERVTVLQGAFIGLVAEVADIDWKEGTAILSYSKLGNHHAREAVEVSLDNLERSFNVGDHVRVAVGIEKGRQGIIFSLSPPLATILDDKIYVENNGLPHPSEVSTTFLLRITIELENSSQSSSVTSSFMKPYHPSKKVAIISHQALLGRERLMTLPA